ncbi:MAG: HigA family addiction module antidote protein [Prevotellaceae bacterium]|jgi:addiction module HigA family antidote|nr:HigA family addiction module antidote protein [Prevotellaceae bacterium]
MITIKGVDPRMIANNLDPSEPIHPGELLKEEIEYRGIPQAKLAERMGMPCMVLNEVLNCKRAVTAEYALLLEAALGIEADMWIRAQTDYSMQTAKRNKSFAQRLAEIRKVAAVL